MATTIIGRVGFGPFAIRFPNFGARADALRFHDINHIVTGYPPVQWKGEMELAYFEFGTGLGKFWAGWMFDSLAIVLALRWPVKGMARIPQRTEGKTKSLSALYI